MTTTENSAPTVGEPTIKTEELAVGLARQDDRDLRPTAAVLGEFRRELLDAGFDEHQAFNLVQLATARTLDVGPLRTAGGAGNGVA